MRGKYSSVAGASIPSDVRSIAISLHSGAALELTSLEFRVATKGTSVAISRSHHHQTQLLALCNSQRPPRQEHPTPHPLVSPAFSCSPILPSKQLCAPSCATLYCAFSHQRFVSLDYILSSSLRQGRFLVFTPAQHRTSRYPSLDIALFSVALFFGIAPLGIRTFDIAFPLTQALHFHRMSL
jgi:hypothetical protein